MTHPAGPPAGKCVATQTDDSPRPGAASGDATVTSESSGSDCFHLFRLSQAFEDAIVFRRARAGAYCADCDDAPGASRCDDHARDLALIASYSEDARAVSAAIDQATSGRLAASTP